MGALESILVDLSLPVAVRAGQVVEHPRPRAVLSGAFNPLHRGHQQMAAVAARILGTRVDFELSRRNVDKPGIAPHDLVRRLTQFADQQTVWITDAATFAQKAASFPGATFVIGADTATRVGEPRYYNDSVQDRNQSLRSLAERSCRFLVFGRLIESAFCELSDLALPAALKSLCCQVEPAEFRVDISSSSLRSAPGK